MLNLSSSTLRNTLAVLVLSFFISTNVDAQSYNKTSSFRSYWQFSANGGTSLFFGDMKQYTFWPVTNNENEWRFAGGVQLNKQLSPVFGIRGQAVYGQLSGTRRSWNRYFESNYIEFNLNTTISIRNIISSYNSQRFWDAYFVFGIGITNYNTEVKDLATKQVVKKVGYGNGKSFGGRTLQGILTGGLGFDFRLSDRWNVKLESVNRIMNSDDLDGWVSHFEYDVYNYTSIGISYKFGIKKAPKRSDDYDYFEPTDKKDDGKEKEINETEYDYYGTNPVEPPVVDVLVIQPVETKDTIAEEIPVTVEPIEEVAIIEEPVIIETIITGVEYRVQISARYNRELSIQQLSNRYDIPAVDIKENNHNGFYIYTVGSFTTYEQAREKRNQLRNSGIGDAFVVAFENGQRLNKLPQQQ